ncbi:MAG: hypothetical protein SO232_01505 [Candidatus Onthovivens sp.]|nr:hypothetical protein [Candidatus Onthovivens sp.]
MKKKNKKWIKVFTGVLATVIVVGGVGVVARLSNGFRDWDVNNWTFDETFKDVKIEAEQTKVHTGTALVPDVEVPEGYEVSMTIMKAEEVVEEAIEIGDYSFKITVKTGDKTKDYDVILHIVEDVETEVTNSEFIQLKTLSVSTNAAGQTEKVVSYTVSGNLDPQKIVGALTWTSPDVEDDISTFMTTVLNKEAKTITLTCLQAFSNQMTYTIYSEELAEAKASITIDYQQKVLTEASVDISSTNSAFGDGLKITTTTKAPTYSAGSILIEHKPNEDLRFTYNWKAADGTQFNSILPSTSDITLGDDGNGVYYDDKNYTSGSLSSMITAIGTKVTSWLNGLVTSKSVTVDLDELKELFTYGRNVRQSYGGYLRVNSTELFDDFVTNFNNKGKVGCGFQFSARAYEKEDVLVFTSIDATKTLGDLSFTGGNVIF